MTDSTSVANATHVTSAEMSAPHMTAAGVSTTAVSTTMLCAGRGNGNAKDASDENHRTEFQPAS